MNIPKISIVMPSLNVRPYIEQCIESALNQTLEDIEIICVDAGSTDGTLEVLYEYEKKDSRVKVVLSDKKSYGYQVNLGFDNSTGEYFAILETDDIINLQMYEKLYEVAVETGVDIVKADFCRFMINDGVMKKEYAKIAKDHMYNKILTAQHDAKDIITNAALYTWSGIYKRSFLFDNGIKHNETPGASYQDNGFWFQTMATADSVYFLSENFYMLRRDNPNSSVYNKQKVYCIRDEYEFVLKYLKARPELYEKVIKYYWWARFGAYRYNYRRIAVEFKSEFIQHFYEVFLPVWNSPEFDESIFSKTSYNDLKNIITDPIRYDSNHKKETSRASQSKTYFNRLKWCYEDNGFIYTAKHIVERVIKNIRSKIKIQTTEQRIKKLYIRPVTKRIDNLEKTLISKLDRIIRQNKAQNEQLLSIIERQELLLARYEEQLINHNIVEFIENLENTEEMGD